MLSHGRIAEIAERLGASDPTDSFWREFAEVIQREALDGGSLGMTQVPVVTLGKMHDHIATLEKIEKRYLWLTRHAYIGECFTHEGTILEVQNTNYRVPIYGTVDRAIDAAIAAEAPLGVPDVAADESVADAERGNSVKTPDGAQR